MSSILEALKKLEDEKAARRGGAGNLAGKVAKGGHRPRRVPAWLIPGSMLAVAVVSVLITYLAMSGGSPHRSEPPAAKKAPEGAQTPDSLLSPAGIPVTEPLKPRELQQPSQKNRQRTAGAAAGNHARVPESAVKAEDRASSTPAIKPADSAGASLPTMSVSGIAWQKDNAFRMAVVNDVPVREGGTVEGATVTEILPDRVRFSFKGKEFEASLEK
ncbi:MAG TPA: general secretion pathway protein GspB [Geobacteraceae bacterium]|nr:general secretion pathway protein GspB [Geobacteraceae bacterium]